MMEYKDIDMSRSDKFSDFSICAVENCIDKYKESKMGKIVEIMLLPVTLFVDDDKVSIEDQICFVSECFA